MKDDVISRHGVSAWLDNMGHPELADAVMDENRFPSAQPERLTDDDFETIRIHLSAFKESLCNQRRWGEAKDYERLIDRFMSFASERPEITEEQVREYCRKRCLSVVGNELLEKYANVCQDTISRRAAIDAVHKNYDVILDFTSDGQTISSSIEDILSELPSAQPEVAKDTNVLTNDCISRQAVIDAINSLINRFEQILRDIRETKADDSVCGMCEYDGAYIGQSGDWCNECPGFEKDDCFKLSEACRKRWLESVALPSAQPERKREKWINGTCNQCGSHAPYWAMATTYYESNFCPNCGAEMEENE